MKRVRQHLSYANVMSTVGVFLLLAGGTAFAAHQLAKNSVGKKQLKSNAVTTAKIKKNAVTTAKIKDSAINSAKIADSSVTGTDINAATTPFGRVVAHLVGSGTVSVPNGESFANIPFQSPTYTQEAGRDDNVVGAAQVTIDSSCETPRQLEVFVLVDAPDPAHPQIADVAAIGAIQETTGGGVVSRRVNLGPYPGGNSFLFQPTSATNHTFSPLAVLECKGAGGSATVGPLELDIIGVK